jgi:hypothetical protein
VLPQGKKRGLPLPGQVCAKKSSRYEPDLQRNSALPAFPVTKVILPASSTMREGFHLEQ